MDTHLLTSLDPAWTAELSDVARIAAWSPRGRLLIVASDGTALVDRPEQVCTPIGPDPVGAAWLDDDHVVVSDRTLGLIAGGRRRDDLHGGAIAAMGVIGTTLATAVDDAITIRDAAPGPPTTLRSRCGRVRAIAPVTATIWVVVGELGWTVLDVRLDVVEHEHRASGCVSVAVDPASARYAVADLSGRVQVATVGVDADVQVLDGYPDLVRHLAWAPGGSVLAAVADDEVTWWSVDVDGDVASAPESSVAHSAPISRLAIAGHPALAATGDVDGRLCLWSPSLVDRPVDTHDLDGEITLLSWNSPGDRLVVGTITGTVVAYDVVRGSIA